MPRLLLMIALIVLSATQAAAAPAEAAWRGPVPGAVTRDYAYSARSPFAAGQRRGIDLASRPGEMVLAACSGRVTHAGPVPRHGLGVTVRCARLVATHLGLGRVLVGRGAALRTGAPIGTTGAAGVVRLGARLAGRRFGYVDPNALLGREPRPLGPAPVTRRRPPRRVPLRAPPTRAAPSSGPARPGRLPLAAQVGAALLAWALVASVAARWAPSTSPRRSTTSTRPRTSATRIRRSRPT